MRVLSHETDLAPTSSATRTNAAVLHRKLMILEQALTRFAPLAPKVLIDERTPPQVCATCAPRGTGLSKRKVQKWEFDLGVLQHEFASIHSRPLIESTSRT
jgi:hypothetical protein